MIKSPTPSHPQKITLIPTYIFLYFTTLSIQTKKTPITPQPPNILLKPLFNNIQNTKLFPNQKTFTDTIPNNNPLIILTNYRIQQNQNKFNLHHFININFTLPKKNEKYIPPKKQSLHEHIDKL